MGLGCMKESNKYGTIHAVSPSLSLSLFLFDARRHMPSLLLPSSRRYHTFNIGTYLQYHSQGDVPIVFFCGAARSRSLRGRPSVFSLQSSSPESCSTNSFIVVILEDLLAVSHVPHLAIGFWIAAVSRTEAFTIADKPIPDILY